MVWLYGMLEKRLNGLKRQTTNQRTELMAVIMGLREVKDDRLPVTIYSDSAYIINCINDQWFKKWQDNSWQTADKKDVRNQDLWQELLSLYAWFCDGNREIEFCHVKGHSGDKNNDVADWLARSAIRGRFVDSKIRHV